MDKNELVLLIQAQAESAKASLKGLKQEFSNIKTETNSLSGSFKKLGRSIFNLYVIKKSVGYLMNAMKSSVDYTETLNLFTVALGNNVQKGIKFQNQLNESFGTNKEELMRSQGLYTALATSLGLASDQAYTLGENMTKLSLDLSSLYNKDIETVNQALKSGLVGQTKAVRQLGMDITEKTLNAQLLSMGITDKTTAVMSQTEKVVLRYIVMLKQATLSQADFAKTIESPANQLRILKQQIAEISRWIGNIFYGVLKNILPYINAFAMVIKEVIKSIAIVFGYTEQSFGGATTSVEELETGLGDADANAKKLKNTLQSFDEIHNIETDTGGDGTASVGGIDSRLLEAMSSYDNKMAGVSMRATQIRDRIMEWLGFTKTVNEETGEVSFKLKDGYQNLEKIGDAFKALLYIFIGIKAVSVISSIVSGMGGAIKIVGLITTAVSTFGTTAVSAIGAISAPILIIIGAIALLTAGFVDLYKNNDRFKNSITSTITNIKNVFTELFEKAIKPAIELLKNVLTPIINIILDVLKILWQNVIKPLSDFIASSVIKVIQSLIKILSSLTPVFELIINVLTWLWKNVLEPIVNWIWTNFKPIFESVFKTIKDVIGGLKEVFGGLIDFITGVFTGDWKLAWNGIKNVFIGIVNILIDAINLFVKLALVPLNTIIKGINIPLKALGLKTISEISITIPKLKKFANGGFPTTGELFVANEKGAEMVGNVGNKTAVVNNDQIVSAVSQGVAQAVAGVLGGKNGTNQFQLFIGGKEITDLVVKDINGMTQQFGTSPLK